MRRFLFAALFAISAFGQSPDVGRLPPLRVSAPVPDSAGGWEKIQRPLLLKRMQEVMGNLPGLEKRSPLNVKIVEEVDCGTYLRRFVTYESEPGGVVPAYLLIPKEALKENRSTHGILCLHQTRREGHKVVVGLADSPNDHYGVELVERGYVCLAPAYPQLANYSPDLKALAYASGTMKAIWDNMRGLDLLESLPFVRKGEFGAIGHSLGGHNSLYTAAFDPRIKVVATSCGFDSFRDYMNGNIKGWTSERYMPRLLNYSAETYPFDFPDVLAAIAPRSIFISAPKGDTNFRWHSVARVVEAALPVYDLFKGRTNIVVKYPDIGHTFPIEMREEAYDMIDRVLRRD